MLEQQWVFGLSNNNNDKKRLSIDGETTHCGGFVQAAKNRFFKNKLQAQRRHLCKSFYMCCNLDSVKKTCRGTQTMADGGSANPVGTD